MHGTTSADPIESSRWLPVGLHSLFLVLAVLAVLRAGLDAAAPAGLALAGWYLFGVAMRTRSRPRAVAGWLAILTLA